MSESTAAPRIWVDGDACPNPVKDMLFRAAERTGVCVTLVANRPIRVPALKHVTAMQVASGFDAADDAIAERAVAGDLVITADIPLAAKVIENGAQALNPRGQLYDAGNIAAHLSMRNFMDELRGSGVDTGGPSSFGPRERQAFGAQLDRWLRSTQSQA
ncbi:YaiI/YqxD family protein [Oleiagrimonas sp. C23AA]|uniref:YaiI/YqxD family protein n=1 Tax=Oleiagrimonas sp. C23AA TaxID=2719047 RepID=UPI001420220B|nr:YaiI/YqxD family protein [Oleiagrimonas sp. C23AA]NII11796.1 YaiI/YqxD family protein [Oleiagrimonas sp. C23AA]